MNESGHEPASEWATRPAAVIVHDPVAAGAFDALDPQAPPDEFLFRDRPDTEVYGRQHAAFVAELRRHVPRVHLLGELASGAAWRQTRRSVNQVFTRDSLITLPWEPRFYIKSRMKPPQRRAESDTMEEAVRRLGLLELVSVPDSIYLEGGDVVPFAREGRRTLLVGHGPRTTRAAAQFLAEALVPVHVDEVIAIELADWRMNLDGGFLPVAQHVVLADTRSVVGAERMDGSATEPIDLFRVLDAMGMHVIDVTREESIYLQACNCITLGGRRVLCYDLCPRVANLMIERGIEVHAVAGSELVKGRGGPRCMSRPVY